LPFAAVLKTVSRPPYKKLDTTDIEDIMMIFWMRLAPSKMEGVIQGKAIR